MCSAKILAAAMVDMGGREGKTDLAGWNTMPDCLDVGGVVVNADTALAQRIQKIAETKVIDLIISCELGRVVE